MTLRLLLGCNLASLLGTRLITLLWVEVAVVVRTGAVAAGQEDLPRGLLLYLLALHTQLRLVQVVQAVFMLVAVLQMALLLQP
jgi:hypothetical protein